MESIRRLFQAPHEPSDEGRYESIRCVFQRLPVLYTERLILRDLSSLQHSKPKLPNPLVRGCVNLMSIHG